MPAGILVRIVGVILAAVLSGCAPGAGSGPGGGSAGGGSAAAADPAGLRAASGGSSCPAPSPTSPGAAESRLPVRSLCALPPEAGAEWRTIAGGSRQRYPEDGGTFQNAERRLPLHQRGYYHEYTVITPGSRDRGARRFITGSGHELYYTSDHYGTFVVVDPNATGR
jgi:guanyl-specific ribonuclease Sa